MKIICAPPQFILVGLESNQHGHAASHEQPSSSCPEIFHDTLPPSFVSPAMATPAVNPTNTIRALTIVFISLLSVTQKGYGWLRGRSTALPCRRQNPAAGIDPGPPGRYTSPLDAALPFSDPAG